MIRAVFYKEPLYKEPSCRKSVNAKNLAMYTTVLLDRKSVRTFSSLNIVITANNQELESRCHIHLSKIKLIARFAFIKHFLEYFPVLLRNKRLFVIVMALDIQLKFGNY